MKFRLNSYQRRMERYKIIYIWNSFNGIVPSLVITSNDENSNLRIRRVLKIPRINGINGSSKTLQRRSLTFVGVCLFNSFWESLRVFKGKQTEFKKILDSFLTNIPDCLETESLKPKSRNSSGQPSNSFPDWLKL